MQPWKPDWEESKKRYLDWWNGKGIVLSMWEHIAKKGEPYENVDPPPPARDKDQFWFDPEWRAEYLHYQLSRSSFKADIIPVANTHLGPGSLAAILGADLVAGTDTVWIRQCTDNLSLELDENNIWWQMHIALLKACKAKACGKYYTGCPDLVEGLDTLAAIRGTQEILTEMVMKPEMLEEQLWKVNEVYFSVFDRIYEIIREDDGMAFCYFSLWAPDKVAKLQSDISAMISEEDFRRFVLPYIGEQCREIAYTLYHLDGVDALRHLDAILEIEELNAIQWTPGYGEPQGGDPCWYGLYRKILSSGKSVMPCWVQPGELHALLDNTGTDGLNILMDFKSEKDIDNSLRIIERYRTGGI